MTPLFFFNSLNSSFYDIDIVLMVEKAHPPTRIPANTTPKPPHSTVGGLVEVMNLTVESHSNEGNTPGTHCRGNKSCRGVQDRPISPPYMPITTGHQNTPATRCCGDESVQGDLGHKDQPDTIRNICGAFERKKNKFHEKKRSFSANMESGEKVRKRPKTAKKQNKKATIDLDEKKGEEE